MFQLRSEHMDAFARDQREAFADRVAAHLREHFPDAAALPWQELKAGAAKQVRKAEGYGLELEQELATYATSAWLLGEDFDQRMPAAGAVLSSVKLSGEEKRQWLEEYTREIFARLEKK